MSRNARSMAFVAVALVCLEFLLGGSRRAEASPEAPLVIRTMTFAWADHRPTLFFDVGNVGTEALAPSALFILANQEQQEVARFYPAIGGIGQGMQVRVSVPLDILPDPQAYTLLFSLHDAETGAVASLGPSQVTLPELNPIAPLDSIVPTDVPSAAALNNAASGTSMAASTNAIERPDRTRRHNATLTPDAGSWIGVLGFVLAVTVVIAIATWLSSRHTAKVSTISPAPPRIAVVPMETRATEFVHASPSQQLLNLVEQKCRDIEYQSLASIDTQPLNQARPTTQPRRSTGRSTHRHQPTKPKTTGEVKMLWSRGMSLS